MKAEINNENKAKFFALYYDQCVLFTASFVKSYDISYIKGGLEMDVYGKELYLNLKHLSQISDEDLIGISILFNSVFDDFEHTEIPASEIIEFRNELINILEETYYPLILTDYLRSKGYALPWMGLSVEEMTKAGWIKLIEV